MAALKGRRWWSDPGEARNCSASWLWHRFQRDQPENDARSLPGANDGAHDAVTSRSAVSCRGFADSSEWSIKEAMERGDMEEHHVEIEGGHSGSWSGRPS
jgi:hypothetical protein